MHADYCHLFKFNSLIQSTDLTIPFPSNQVCSYRCITSHETPEFEKFALCILQRNNCMGNTASIPLYPDPQPLAQFRGKEITHEVAENIFIGHLQPRIGETNALLSGAPQIPDASAAAQGVQGGFPWSWKVVCGQNPAYDYFSCQHQIFYRDKTQKSVVWYDPVFKVSITLRS